METKVKFSRIAGPLAFAIFLTSCTKFDPLYVLPDLCKPFEDIPTIELMPSNPRVVLEDVGKIMVMHGSGQAKVDTGGRIIKIEQSVDIPS